MSELINVKDKVPQIPCIAVDEHYQLFILRDMVIATDEHGKKNILTEATLTLKQWTSKK